MLRFFILTLTLATTFTVSSIAEEPEKPADLVVVNAKVLTVDPDQPTAEAFAVRDGRFVAVGTDQAIRSMIVEETEIIDAEKKTVVPGFNDAHLHPRAQYPEDSPLASVNLRPSEVKTIDELVAALKRKAEKTPPGQWVRGSGYEDTKLGRHPTRHDLDRVSTVHPVYIGHSSGHMGVFNTYALDAADITAKTKDPSGGAFDREEDGTPNGITRESATSRVFSKGPPRQTAGKEEVLEGLMRQFEEYAANGITSVGVAGGSMDSVKRFREIQKRGCKVRIYMMLSSLTQMKEQEEKGDLGDEHLKLGCVKIFHGNSLSGRTCWLSKPYEDRPDYYGIKPSRSQESLNKRIASIHDAGFQVAVHSNGDREIEMVLNAFEYALKRNPRTDHRHRIEHCSVVTEDLLKRIKKLGLVLAPHSYVWEHGDKMEPYGQWRWDWMHPNCSALEAQIPIAGTSDSPVSQAIPLLRMQSMVTRKASTGKVYGVKQRVSPEQALHTWTLGSAYASFDEKLKGSITPGKLADFVILSDDPLQVDPESIRHIHVLRTVIGGETVFRRP